MTTILYITSSVRELTPESTKHISITRQLGEQFITAFTQANKATEIIYRDLSIQPPSFIDQRFIAAAFGGENITTEQQQALAESDRLIAEVEHADIIVIASPMYNYGMPAVLKAWFDQVIRINKTFSFDLARGDQPLAPLLFGKEVVLLASWGESEFNQGEARYGFNHLSSHIEQLAPYLGGERVHHIASQYQEFGDDRHQASKTAALLSAQQLAQTLAAARQHNAA